VASAAAVDKQNGRRSKAGEGVKLKSPTTMIGEEADSPARVGVRVVARNEIRSATPVLGQ
jgi:hypothetical protein